MNKKTEDSMTGLHLACEMGHLEIVKLLCSGIQLKTPKSYTSHLHHRDDKSMKRPQKKQVILIN